MGYNRIKDRGFIHPNMVSPNISIGVNRGINLIWDSDFGIGPDMMQE